MRSLRPKTPSDDAKDVLPRPQVSSAKGPKIGFAIRREDVLKHKPTRGCRGCVQIRQGSYGVHTQECKVRFEKIFRENGDPRIYTYDARFEDELSKAKKREEEKVPSGDEPNAKKQKVSTEEEDKLFACCSSTGFDSITWSILLLGVLGYRRRL